MRAIDIIKLVVALVACQAAGVVGSVFTASGVGTWYAAINKPAFTPPGGVFAPVWITLYVLMGISAFLVWRIGLQDPWVRLGLIVFLIQLILNTAWSAVFFGARSPLAGFVVIIGLWIMILVNIVLFIRVSRPAGLLLVPYLAWVGFAGLLNGSIWLLNR
jgi:benzodiazapine receptor